MRKLALVSTISALWLNTTAAAGQEAGFGPARSLFDEARGLMKAGQFERACPKLEAARKLYPSPGVLLNLGDCYENTGHVASAWAEFQEAAVAADRAGRPEFSQEARHRRDALEPRISRVVVRAAATTPSELVRLDDSELDRHLWGTALPVDPGLHLVTAKADGRTPWSLSIRVMDGGKTVTVEVPPLVPRSDSPLAGASAGTFSHAGSSPPSATPRDSSPDAPTARRSAWTMQRTWGQVMTGAGAAQTAVAAFLVLAARTRFDLAETEAGTARMDDSLAAVHTGNAATVVLAVGVPMTIAGIVLWVTAPSGRGIIGAVRDGLTRGLPF